MAEMAQEAAGMAEGAEEMERVVEEIWKHQWMLWSWLCQPVDTRRRQRTDVYVGEQPD